jgi:uncharacterized protein (TIRG00374 family)
LFEAHPKRPLYLRKRLWGGVFAVVILYLLFHDLDFPDLWHRVRSLAWWLLPLATVCQFVMMTAKAERWRLLVQAEADPPLRRMFTLYVVGYLLNITLPALTGQVGRVYLLARRERVSHSFATATVTVETLADMIAILLLVIAVSPFIRYPTWLLRSFIAVAVGAVVIGALLFLAAHRNRALLAVGRWFARLFPQRMYSPFRRLYYQFRSGLSALRSTEHVFLVMLLSCGAWIAQSAGVFVVLRAFDLQIPLHGAVLVMVVNTLMVAFPLTPGNAGTFEFATMSVLSLYGVQPEAAAAFAVVLHLTDIVPPYLFGLGALAAEGMSLAAIGRDARAAREAGVPPDEPE